MEADKGAIIFIRLTLLSMLFYLLTGCTTVYLLTGCTTDSVSTESVSADISIITVHSLSEITQTIENKENKIVSSESATKLKSNKCKSSYSPPIKDKTKIKDMLKRSGKITLKMTESEQKHIVDNFIHNKMNTNKSCKL